MKKEEVAFLEFLKQTQHEEAAFRFKGATFFWAFQDLKKVAFKDISLGFLNDPLFLEAEKSNFSIKFWALFPRYFTEVHPDKRAKILSDIEATLSYNTTIDVSLHKRGIDMPSSLVFDPELIRQVYSSNNAKLMGLFKKHLPFPRASLFAPENLPTAIAWHEKEVTNTIKRFEKHVENLKSKNEVKKIHNLEHATTKLQRLFRRKRRNREEVNRVAEYHASFIKHRKISAEKLLQAADQPYIPHTQIPGLKERILATAKKIGVHPIIRHITSSEAIESIFNDALYGRRTLMQLYIPFSPAALGVGDRMNGDGNVICFGPGEIDPKATGDIEIVLDVKKIVRSKNPTAFYKVMDLFFNEDPSGVNPREVKLSDNQTIFFSPAAPNERMGVDFVYFKILHSMAPYGYSLECFSDLPNILMISNNLEKMDQILSLQFFRFIDNLVQRDLRTNSLQKATAYKESFYETLNKMDDEQLKTFMKNAARELTKTAEFNFYGAHKIDFSTVVSIRSVDRDYTLSMAEFISALNQGDKYVLGKALNKLPQIFKSYRFVDYLISQVHQEECSELLRIIRGKCRVPMWMKEEAGPAEEEKPKRPKM